MRKSSPLSLVIFSGISALLLWAHFGYRMYEFLKIHEGKPGLVYTIDHAFMFMYAVAAVGGLLAIIAGILYESAKDRFTATAVAALNFLAIWGAMELHRVGALLEYAEYAKFHGMG